jgi:hypothetical protein
MYGLRISQLLWRCVLTIDRAALAGGRTEGRTMTCGLWQQLFRKPPGLFDSRGVFDGSTWGLGELSWFIADFVSG